MKSVHNQKVNIPMIRGFAVNNSYYQYAREKFISYITK